MKKRCSKCGEEKERQEFYGDCSKSSKRRRQCKKCVLENQKIWRLQNKEIIKERNRLYRINNSVSLKRRKKKYYIENQVSIRRKAREYYSANKIKIREKWKQLPAKYERQRKTKQYPSTKICTHCKIEKVRKEYNRDKYSKDGLQDHCKQCQRKYWNNYYKKNRKIILIKIHSDEYKTVKKEERNNLCDYYVKQLIWDKCHIPKQFISKDMIQRERELIQINRMIRKDEHGYSKKIV